MIVNEPTGLKDVDGKEIQYGNYVEIIADKTDSLVSKGQRYRVYVENGIPAIQVGVALEEVAPHYCRVVDGR